MGGRRRVGRWTCARAVVACERRRACQRKMAWRAEGAGGRFPRVGVWETAGSERKGAAHRCKARKTPQRGKALKKKRKKNKDREPRIEGGGTPAPARTAMRLASRASPVRARREGGREAKERQKGDRGRRGSRARVKIGMAPGQTAEPRLRKRQGAESAVGRKGTVQHANEEVWEAGVAASGGGKAAPRSTPKRAGGRGGDSRERRERGKGDRRRRRETAEAGGKRACEGRGGKGASERAGGRAKRSEVRENGDGKRLVTEDGEAEEKATGLRRAGGLQRTQPGSLGRRGRRRRGGGGQTDERVCTAQSGGEWNERQTDSSGGKVGGGGRRGKRIRDRAKGDVQGGRGDKKTTVRTCDGLRETTGEERRTERERRQDRCGRGCESRGRGRWRATGAGGGERDEERRQRGRSGARG